jgi:4-amino-4-deoxy-L-arabinose transferase
MSLALLTKGPVGFLIPVLGFGTYLAVEGRLRDLRRAFSAPALALSLGPIGLWLAAAVALAPPGFFGETVGGGLISRFFSGTSHARPVYYFLYQFPVEFLPWCLLWPAVFWAARRRVFVDGADPERRRAWRFLLVQVGVSFVFFSISAGKRGLYLLPCFPATALLCADALEALLAGRARPPRALSIGAALAAAALIGVAAYFGLHRDAEVAGAELPLAFLVLLVVAPLLAAAAWIACVRSGRTARVAWVAVACAWTIELGVFQGLYPALDGIRSMKPVARAALRWLPPDAHVALLGSESMIGGLQYYAERPVDWVDDIEDLPAWLDAGGTSIVMEAKKLPKVREWVDVTVLERLREGERELVVVRPSRPGEAGRPAPPPGPSRVETGNPRG